MKIGVIGVGNMGSKYASLIIENSISNFELAAVTRIKPEYETLLEKCRKENVPVYESADKLFEAVENGTIALDAVIIATPHYSHEELALRAFKNGLHVLCDKPSGVYLRQANSMNEHARKSGKNFGLVFNQRTNPLYKRMKEIVESKIFGDIKRVNWIVTDWYRPEKYYHAAAWRATWENDGGGVLLNQCPHNLDLLQWICGMPDKVQGFCHNGRFHDIEVEDDVTAYLEWENGANGTFITSTGDAPGINRLEISLDEALLVCENGELRIAKLEAELGMKEADYRKTSEDFFKKIKGTWEIEKFDAVTEPYKIMLQNFSDVLNSDDGTLTLIAPGEEGRKSLLLSNAIYLSSWEQRMIILPKAGTKEEKDFEKNFEMHLNLLKNK